MTRPNQPRFKIQRTTNYHYCCSQLTDFASFRPNTMVSTKKSGEELAKQKKKTTKQTAPPNKKKVSTLSKSKQGKPKDDKEVTNGIPRAKHKRDVALEPSSSAESVEEDEGVGETQEVDAKNSKVTKNRNDKAVNGKRSEKRRKERAVDDDSDDGDERTTCRFPLARVKRIMKNHSSNLMLSHDAVFLVNKAAERFLEQFCEDAYECSVRDRKKSLGYKQLSSVVQNESRFDFLSDYVPEKLTAEDALAERRSADTGEV